MKETAGVKREEKDSKCRIMAKCGCNEDGEYLKRWAELTEKTEYMRRRKTEKMVCRKGRDE